MAWIGGALALGGSVLGGLFQNDAASTQADATLQAANTAAGAANPHLAWQQQQAIPYLTKVLQQQQMTDLPANKVRSGSIEQLLPLLEQLKGIQPSLFDMKSQPATGAQRLRDVGMNELTDRVNNPMAFDTYRDREALSSLAEQTMLDPTSFLTGPYKDFFDKAGESAIERSAAAKGQLGSGELLKDLGLFGGKEAQNSMQQFLTNLSSLAGQRGNMFTQDESSALQGMTAGNSLLASLLEQNTAQNQGNEAAISGRVGTLANLFNLANTSKSDPYFDKLVSLAGGQPAAAANAITQGQAAASQMNLAGTGALASGVKNAIDLAKGIDWNNVFNTNQQQETFVPPSQSVIKFDPMNINATQASNLLPTTRSF